MKEVTTMSEHVPEEPPESPSPPPPQWTMNPSEVDWVKKGAERGDMEKRDDA